MSDTVRYDSKTIVFHWLTAGLIVVMWGLAQVIDFFPTAVRVYPRSAHILIGLALLVIFGMRLFWRNTSGRHLPPADRGILALAAKGAHWGLYIVVGVTLVLGVYYEAIRGDNILNLGRLPSIAPGDKALRNMVGDWHGTAANIILILAGLHAAAGLVHHYVLKDGVLRRMLSSQPG